MEPAREGMVVMAPDLVRVPIRVVWTLYHQVEWSGGRGGWGAKERQHVCIHDILAISNDITKGICIANTHRKELSYSLDSVFLLNTTGFCVQCFSLDVGSAHGGQTLTHKPLISHTISDLRKPILRKRHSLTQIS